jgi:tetratricopeptide (TPR) repeat protein
VAHKLNVASVLEGSVRRSGHTIRVTAQLDNGVTGYHIWSQSYDRDLGDVLKLQTEIATAVASALKVSLLGDEAAKIEAGGTRNPAALDAYLRANQTLWGGLGLNDVDTAVAGYTEAIRLDADYALAYAARALAISAKTYFVDTTTSAVRADLDRMRADAAKAISLAPNLSEGYLARALVYQNLLEFKEASENYDRALALAPSNARVLRDYGHFAVIAGHGDSGLTAVQRAVVLDPLNSNSHGFLGAALLALRRYPEAIAAFEKAEALVPSKTLGRYPWQIGTAYYLLGDFASARATCEQGRDNFYDQLCLALAYDKLGRHADAEAALKKAQTTMRDSGSYQYAAIYAQWGNRPKALEWLDIAMHRRAPFLLSLKTDPLMDPLRTEARFQAIVRALKFPD